LLFFAFGPLTARGNSFCKSISFYFLLGYNFLFRATTTHESEEAYVSALQLRLCENKYKLDNFVLTQSRIAQRDPGMFLNKMEQNYFAKAIFPSSPLNRLM